MVKEEIISKICYTELVYGRINKKLGKDLSRGEIESYVLDILTKTGEESYVRIGKNYYVTNEDEKVRITVNSNTFRVITVDRVV